MLKTGLNADNIHKQQIVCFVLYQHSLYTMTLTPKMKTSIVFKEHVIKCFEIYSSDIYVMCLTPSSAISAKRVFVCSNRIMNSLL